MGWRRKAQIAAIVLFLIAYSGLSHYSNLSGRSPALGVALALGPPLVLALLLIWRSIHLSVALLAAAAAAVLLVRFWPLLAKDFSLVFLWQECAVYGLLGLTFGLSLRRGRVPLCTDLADRVHGPLTPQELRYTRRLTAVWASFFVLITATTCGLYCFVSLRAWSTFANFCVLPLIGCLFVVEYMVRRKVLDQPASHGVLAAVRVYFAGSR
jgi:uncharacterized membrane protein